MPKRFFLNPLKDGGVLGAPSAGQWTSDEIRKDFLINYTQDINLGQPVSNGDPRLEVDLRRVHNVPSVFARPIQFSQALADRNHPLHATVTAQWRGLLATFALQHSIGANIVVSQYDVPPAEEAGDDGIRAAVPANRNLNVMLRNQLPRPASDWERWWMFRCDGALIGATSPWTVVYTPAEYRVPKAIPWRDDDGLFIDPIRFFDPKTRGERPEMLGLLSRWVSLVLGRFESKKSSEWGFRDGLSEKAAAIRWALQQWSKELARYGESAPASVETMPDSPIEGNPEPYAHFLAGLVGSDEKGDQPGDLLAKTDRGGSLIVFSKQGIPPATRVYGGVFSGDVSLEKLEKSGIGPANWTTMSGKTVKVPYRVVEDAFFTPKLLEIGLETGGENSLGALQCGSVKYALPLTADFFRFFGLQSLVAPRGMLTLKEVNGEILARLAIPLRNGGTLKTEKTYGRDSIAKLPDIPVPVLALWPDFGADDWTQNYAAFAVESHPRNEVKLLAAPILEDGSVLERTVEEGTKDRPKQSSCRVWCAEKPAIGFALHLRETKGDVAVGVVLRQSLEEPKSTQATLRWDVGIDFGTSNTQVMYHVPGTEAEPLTFNHRTLVLTSAPEANIPLVTRNLFPCATDPLPPQPLPTALRVADATRFPDPGGDTKWAELNFGPERNFFATNLVPNVKWGTPGAAAADDSIQRYLTGLLRVVLCEARSQGVGEIEFRWSYPRSLPSGAFSKMSSFWSAAPKRVTDKDKDKDKIVILTPKSMTESEAMCRYFGMKPLRGLPVHASSLSVAIDVGGGSSDVAYWLAGQLVDISSFKIAANDILVPAVEFPGFAEQVVSACGAAGPAVVEALKSRPGVVINALLTQAKVGAHGSCDLQRPGDHPLVNALHAQLGSGSPPWLPIRSAIYLFFMGLTYYAGLHARDVVERYRDVDTAPDGGGGGGVSAGGRAPVIQHRQVGLYFGGLGSSLLTWIHADAAKLRDVLEFAFQKGLSHDYANGGNFEIKPLGAAVVQERKAVEHPKEEVVRGLLADELGPDPIGASSAEGPETSTILCEIGWKDTQGKVVEWNTRLTAEKLRELRAPRNHDSGYMAQFLGSVLPKHARALFVDHEALGRLEIDSSQLDHLMKLTCQGEQTVLQPVFAHELKTVLEQYLRTAAR